MKLRQLPEDFKVEEIASRTPQKEGKYCLYLLEKRGLETVALIKDIARKHTIPLTDFGIAGLKDRHAVSKQYITLPKQKEISNTKENNFSLTRVGYTDTSLKIGDLRGNKFEITVRDIPEKDLSGVLERVEQINYGVPNYFDSQRFGSVIHNEFIAEKIAKEDYEAAVKLFLTAYSRHEAQKQKQDKRLIKEKWEQFGTLRLDNTTFQRIQKGYVKNKDWKEAYLKIPLHLRKIFAAAHQSYQWNENVKTIIEKVCMDSIKVKYKVGELFFYGTLSDEQKKQIPKKVLCGTHERPALVTPRDFSMTKPAPDELNKNKYKTTLAFTLPKGSYATIITKRIFLQ